MCHGILEKCTLDCNDELILARVFRVSFVL
jgi:hypothetical protein